MVAPDMSQIIADAWESVLRETPDPFRDSWIDEEFGLIPRRTYQQRLDAQPVNFFGEPIPRIVTVRRNLRRFKEGW